MQEIRARQRLPFGEREQHGRDESHHHPALHNFHLVDMDTSVELLRRLAREHARFHAVQHDSFNHGLTRCPIVYNLYYSLQFSVKPC